MATGMRAEVELSINDTQAKRSMERSAAELNRIMGGVGKKQVNFNVNSRSFTQPLGRITGSANEFTKSLEASNARVIAFGASVGIINGISDAFKNLVAETVRFEKTLSDVNVVLNASNASLQQFGQGLFDVAKNTSQSFGVAAEAALEFSRQGLTMEEVLKRTNDALTLTRLTSLKAADAVSGLTAAVNAFADVGLTTTQVIDKLAAVDVKFAVSSEDLINALERTGAVAIDAGVELDSLIGLVTSLQQTTARGGSVIGNGLKTIFTRIQRPQSLKQIEELDIAVRNLSGAVLPADKILINIAKSFDTLTASQKSNVVQFSAGIFQANVFRAALRDLSKDQSIQSRATEVSASAAGEAAIKNAQLNKTIAALASQSGSAIQELAGVMGELMVKPEIGSFLELFKGSIEGITDMLGGGEDQGSTFAKGLVAGIGNVLTGPAAIAFGAVFIKLFMNIAKFAQGSLKDVLDIVTKKDKIKQIEESILETLSKNKDIQESLNNLEGDREQQGKFILKIVEAQTNAMREQEKLASQLARPLLEAGVKTDLTVGGKGPVDLDGDGVMDSFGARGVLPSSSRKERREASRAGYSAGAVDSMSIKGLGQVVYNKAEKVKQFPGMQQPAIMPPQGSRAGAAYQDAFSQKHGFDPYAAGGFVPNFATLDGGALRLNQSKMHLYANPREATPGGNAVRNAMKALVDSGKPVTVSATTDKLLRGEGGSHTKAIKGLIRFIADQENGPKLFERNFKLTNLPWKGNKGEDASEDAVAKMLNKGGGKFINTGKRPGAHGDKTFPVDLIGSGLDPVEVKSGEWQQPNILLKSMRLYSDDELMQFAERQYGATPEMLKGARMEKLGKSARLLQGKGILDKNASLGEQHEAALKYGIAGGFVPNFRTRGVSEEHYKGSLKRQEILKLLQDFISDAGGMTDAELENLPTKNQLALKSGLFGGDARKNLSNIINNSRQGKSMTGTADSLVRPQSEQGARDRPQSNMSPSERGKLRDAIETVREIYEKKSEREGTDVLKDAGLKYEDDVAAKYGAMLDKRGALDFPGGIPNITGLSPADAAITGHEPVDMVQKIARYIALANPMGLSAAINAAGKGGTVDLLPLVGEVFEVLQRSGVNRSPKTATTGANQINTTNLGPDHPLVLAAQKQLKFKGTYIQQSLPAASGFIPNFAGNTTLYRGTSPKYQKAIPDIPNPPQFLFEEIMAAKTKEEFIKAVETLGRQHSMGKYSGSYNDNIRGATLGEIRGREELGVNEVQHGGYVYSRATKGMETTSPSGFVSKSTDKGVAQSFAKALVPGMEYNPNEMGQIDQSTVSNSRIFDQEKLERFVDRFGLERVQQAFKNGMENGTLKDIYLNMHKFKPQQVTDALDMFSNSANDHSYRSIGMSGSGLSRDEKEITQIWSKNSPYYGAYGMIPNFADNRNRQQKISDVLSDPSNAGIKFKGGALKPRSIKSKNMFQKMWLESYFKTGLEGDYQMLMKMGYNPDELLSLRSHAEKGGEVNILGKGFVPNFANPLKEAIAREEAAGIPKSQIRVEQSGQLRGPGNPMGLAVTNKRDEPGGVGQGIRRARSMGMDPRRHGAASGMIPNFADGDEVKIPAALLKELNKEISETQAALDQDLQDAIKNTTDALSSWVHINDSPSQEQLGDRAGVEGSIKQASDELKKQKGVSKDDRDAGIIKELEEYLSVQKELLKAIKANESAPQAMGETIKKDDNRKPGVIAAARKMEFEQIKKLTLAQRGEQKAIEGTVEELQNLQEALHKSEDAAKEETNERSGGLQQLFYMQSAISMTNGFLEQFSEGAKGATKNFLDLATAASNVTAAYVQQRELVNQGMQLTGVGDEERGFSLFGGNEKAAGQARATEARIRGENLQARGGKGLGSIGRIGAVIGKVTRGFGRFLPVVGQLYTGFTLVNEGVKFVTKTFKGLIPGLEAGEGLLDLFASASDRATKRMTELSETADSLKNALGALETQEQEQIELRKLENKGTSRTIAEEKKYYDLRLKSIDTDIALGKAMGNLMDENKTGRRSLERINRVINTTTMSMAEQKEGIRDLILANQMLMAATSQRTLFQEGIERADSDDDSRRLDALAEARGVQMALAMGAAFEGKKGASDAEKTEALSHNIRELEKAIRFRGEDAKSGLDNLRFDTSKAVGSSGISEMLRGAIQDLDEFEWNATDLSVDEAKAYKKSVQELIKMLKKRKDAQSKGLKDDVDINIASRKALQLSLFNIERERERGKHEAALALERVLHNTKLANIQSGILKDHEGISTEAHIELEARRAANDRTAKYEHDLEESRRSSIEALDKIIGKDLSDPGMLAGDIMTGLGNASQAEVDKALAAFQDRIQKGASFGGPLEVGGKKVSQDELRTVNKAFAEAAQEAGGKDDAVLKLKALSESRLKLETARLQAIFASLMKELEIIDQNDEKSQAITKSLDAENKRNEKIEQQNQQAKELTEKEKIKNLIAAKTIKGAIKLEELLLKSGDLRKIINTNLQGEADTLAVLNKHQKSRISILNDNLQFDRKAFETQVEKNRTEAESALLALRQLEYQEESLELSEESQIIQEAKLRTETLTAGQSAKEAELRYKFLSDYENRSQLLKSQISAEMNGLRTTAMLNRDSLQLKILSGELNETAALELKEQETSLTTEALKNAQLASNLSHLRESGSLTDMANRLQEKSNKLLEAQNASRQAVLSRGDLAFSAKADLITERSGAIGETRATAMRAIMTNSPEDALAFASALEETNKQMGNGTRAVDRLRSKMAELDVSAKNLGADLVDLGIDGVRSGFKQLLEDIGSGAKSAGDAWRDFGLGMAKTLLDRITDHNIDRIVKDLTFAFTGVDPMSEAEKIASSNNHLVSANDKLIAALKALEAEVARDQKALEDKVVKPPPKDTPFDGLIAPATKNPNLALPPRLPYHTGMPTMPGAASRGASPSASRGASPSNAVWVQTKGGFGVRGTSSSGGNAPLVFEPDNNTISIGKNSALSKAIGGRNAPMPFTQREEIVKREQDNATRLTTRLNLLRGEKQSGKIFNLAGVSEAQGIANNDQGIKFFAKRAGEVRETIDKKIEDLEAKRDNRLAQQKNLESANQRYRDRDWDGKEPSPTGLNYRNQTGDPNASTLDKTLVGFNRDIYYPYGSESEGKAREVIEYENRQSQAAAAGKEAEGIQAKIDQLKNLKDKQVDEAKGALDRWTDHQRQIQSLTEETSRQVDLAKRLTADLEKSASDARAVFSAAADSLSAKKPPSLTTTVKTPEAKVDAVSMDVDAARVNFFGNIHQVDRQQGGGIIQHFADGGFVKGPGGKDKVPAMLTAGEFVIPKKEVNRAFNFMGQNVRGSGDTIEGMRKNQSVSSQSQEARDILAAEGGKYVQKFNRGGLAGSNPQKTFWENDEEKPKGRTQRGVEGGLKAWAMVETARAVSGALNKDVDKPPTFNMKKLDSLDLGSDVNLKRGDPRLSARFLAKDPVMQEYRDYLLESANYRVQKTNQEFREDMSTLSSVFSAVTSFATAELVSIAKPHIEKGITATKNWAGETFGRYGDDYAAAKSMAEFRGEKLNYSDFKKSYKSFKQQGKEGFFQIGGNLHLMDDGSVFDMSSPDTFAIAARDPGLGRKMASFYASGPTGGTPQMKQFVSDQTDIVNRRIGGPKDWMKWGSRKADDFGLDKIFTHRKQGGGSIPAMLTAGEGYIPEPIAKRIGYNNLSHMNNTGTMPIVKGTGGIDNVGPVSLNSGDFIMKKSSTNKLLRDNPNAMRFSLQGQSDGRRGVQGYYEGGIVGSELTVPARSLGPQKSQQENRLQLLDQKENEKTDSSIEGSTTNAETTNNININISIDKSGAEVESQEGGEDSYEKERNLSMKIKGAVLEVIREEKRIGGELS